MNKIYLLSLGCPRNLADSEAILGRLKQKGHLVSDIKDADIGIVNTCAFIKEAKEESIEAILDLLVLKKEGRLKKVIVYGCLVQRYGRELARHLKGVDGFVGSISLNHSKARISLTPKHYAYVKICDGCKNICSYCVIPGIKGKFTSREPTSIIEQVKSLDRAGTSEINIVGQDITLYGSDLKEKTGLVSLLRKILRETKNIRWVRLLYLHPAHINKELLGLIAREPRICKYIDLPVQHINSRILKLMNRKTTKDDIIRLIKDIRARIPDVSIRTSIIVGFPSETEKEFEELLNFISRVKFERLGAFIYSREEGTPACNFVSQVKDKIKQERFMRLMSLQQGISNEVNRKFLGTQRQILIDGQEKDGVYLGRTQSDAPEVDGLVYVRSKKCLKPGEIIRAKIIDTMEYDLVADTL